MNIFRICGDFSHVLSIFILLAKIIRSQTCSGISLWTQVLYVIVFSTRYLDLFFGAHSLYNTTLKLLFLGSSYAIVYFMTYHPKVRQTYDPINDTFKIRYLLIGAAILSLITAPAQNGWFEYPWTFSIYLESVAILPQLFMLQRRKEAEALTAHYIFALGAYRALYVLNWIVRYYTEAFYPQMDGVYIVWFCGIVQTLLYIDFFYYYVKETNWGAGIMLPSSINLDR